MRYTFKEIAFNSTEKRIPLEEDRITYIGLEHLDSRKLTITRYGSDVPLKGEKLVMRKGDVLFGKRNTYLKRVAIAPFDGLFSAHGMVLRPNEEIIAKDYFPFFLSSDYFLNEAIRISVGSLSPTVNWKDLKELEFEIPDKDRQHELAGLLSAANDLKESYEAMIKATDEMVKSQFIEMFGSSLQNKELSIKLQDLIEKNWITYHLDGNHGGDYPRGEEFVESGIPYISANCIEDHLIKWSRAKYLTKERAELLKKGLAHNNDVLFAHNATVGPVAILRTKEDLVILGTSLTAYRCNTEYILPEYLLAYMDSPVFRVQYEAGMQQSTRNQVPITTQRRYKFFIPPLPAQRKYADVFQHADKSKQIVYFRPN